MNTNLFLQAFLGGGLIGLGAFALMLFNGRIAGISGITFGAIFSQSNGSKDSNSENRKWRWFFILGLVIAPLITRVFGFSLPDTFPNAFGASSNHIVNISLMVIGGLLVGFGTNLGSGCTSGHGICGISRLSGRSITATCVFMISAIITVALIKHMFGGA